MTQAALTDPRSPVVLPGIPRPPAIDALTSVRFLAAMMVALFHFVLPYTRWGVFRPFFRSGYVGVSFFFVLSGFILTYSHAAEYETGKGSRVRFWVARFARIYPLYLICEVFAAWRDREAFLHGHYKAFLAHLLMLQSWSPQMSTLFNEPGWSLSVEALFYFLFPLIFLSFRPRTRWMSVAGIAALWAVALVVSILAPAMVLHVSPATVLGGFPADPGRAYRASLTLRWPPLAVPEFLAGVVAGWHLLRFGVSARAARWMLAAGTATMVGVLCGSDYISSLLMQNGLLIPAFCAIVLGLSVETRASRLLSYGWMVLLGEGSYALYLVHGQVLVLTHDAFNTQTTIANAVWRLAIAISLSIALFIWVERPARGWILRMYQRTGRRRRSGRKAQFAS